MSGALSPQRDNPAYAGEVSAREAWDRLAEDTRALLVDVRSNAEWSFVGLPDLEPLSRQEILIEWQNYPPGPTPNPNFASELAAALGRTGYAKGAPLFFICRSGARSRNAAVTATAAGLGPCFNVSDGFEGALDADRHRGTAEGWKAAGLPWIQS